MAAATPQFGALTLAVTKASALAANAVVVGVLDEFNRGRLYMPFTWGFTPQTGDAATKWLPSVGTVTAIVDPTGAGQVGQYKVTFVPGTADTVNVASVQTMYVDANALFITVTGTF